MKREGAALLFPLFLVLLVAAVALPILSVLLAVSPGEVIAAFGAPHVREAVRTSFLASFMATAAASVLGVPAGYAIAHARARVRMAALFALALPLAFPPVASGVMLLSFLRTTPVPETLLGVAIAEFFVSGSFVAIAAAAAFSVLDPIHADAARTLGASEWRIFLRVALPAAAGNVGAGIAFAWLRAIGEYGATSIVAYHPSSLPVQVYVTLSASGVREALALCYGFVVLAAIVLVLQWILRRSMVQ
jgi:molybdate/tungstate transport system permease protein